MAVHVHRQDGPRAWSCPRGHLFNPHCPRVWLDIDQDGDRPGVERGEHRCRYGEGRHNDLVAGPESRGGDGQVQCRCPACRPDAVRTPTVPSERTLKVGEISPRRRNPVRGEAVPHVFGLTSAHVGLAYGNAAHTRRFHSPNLNLSKSVPAYGPCLTSIILQSSSTRNTCP